MVPGGAAHLQLVIEETNSFSVINVLGSLLDFSSKSKILPNREVCFDKNPLHYLFQTTSLEIYI